MKKTVVLALSALLISTAGMGAAMAEDEMGEFTSANPSLARAATLPFRLLTGGVGAAIGFTGGSIKGMVEGTKDGFEFARETHEKPGEGDNAEAVARNAMYMPTAAFGALFHAPVNAVTGGLTTGWDFAKRGSGVWHRL